MDSYKDLGVIMSKDLSWSNHVNASVNKANKVLGLLKRTVGSKNREIFSILYRSLVRPILEYASPVWSPYLVKDKRAIESIQPLPTFNCSVVAANSKALLLWLLHTFLVVMFSSMYHQLCFLLLFYLLLLYCN